MSSIALRIQNISKKYRIGTIRHDTLRDQIASIASSPFRRTGNRAAPDEDKIWALKDVSFDVHHGEIVGIIGRNGAGKSTLLKILSRITAPTSGRVEIYGRVGSLLEVGTGFHPELTGRENIYLNGAILGMHRTEIKRKFDEIVAFSEIEKFLDTPVKRYSSGMYVRLAFAVAAYLEPEILLVDEVLAVGDIAFQEKCLGKMKKVTQEGRTVLFVSHNLASIKNFCTNTIWLESGKIQAIGVTNNIIEQYRNVMLMNLTKKSGEQTFQKVCNSEHGIEIHQVDAMIDSINGAPIFKVAIIGLTKKKISHLDISIQIVSKDGILVAWVGTRQAHAKLVDIYGEWKFTYIFDKITKYLTSGEYLINVFISRPQYGIILRIENACLVEIPLTDVYQTGDYHDGKRHGFVPLPVRYSFSQNKPKEIGEKN